MTFVQTMAVQLQNVPAQIIVLDDVLQAVSHGLGVDRQLPLGQLRRLEGDLFQQPLHDREEPACADVLRALVDLHSGRRDLLDTLAGEVQRDAFRLEQGRILLDQGVLGLRQDADEVVLRQGLQNALIKQYTALLETEGITLDFTREGIEEIAATAVQVNERSENIGARRLFTIMERLLEEISFEAPELTERKLTIDAQAVRNRLKDIIKDDDLSRYIL